MSRSYERTIRWKAIGMYMFIAVICLAVSMYIYTLSRNVTSQKRHIETYYDLLRVTNQVTFAVSDAQSTANLYLTSKNRTHLASFRNKVSQTETLIDSLTLLSRLTGDTSNLGPLAEIGSLLRQKGDLIYHLNTQLVSYNPVDSIAQRLFLIDDSSPERTTVNDSVFLLGGRKNLLDVMSNAFIPGRYRDSLITAYQIRPDTIPVEQAVDDSIKIAAGVRQYVEEVRSGYSTNLREVERQINRLMRTDQEISAQIIDVLNRFHRTTMVSTIRHIEDSEITIQRNYRYSMAGIVMSLLLITLFVILIISDANKGQSARQALERANTHIREIMASRHKLLLSVSHDIKTPLNTILGYLELWKQGQDADPSQIAAAELSGKHIGSLVNNLLEFSSLQQGISKPSPHPANLLSFCEETARMITRQAEKKGLAFETGFDFTPDLCVSVDSMRLRQIILNLLSNSVKYTQGGRVVLKASYGDGKVKITVSDTGAGMTSEELEKMFKPFSRLDGNRAMAEGHGYGMYVVKGLVELLDGEIMADSMPGKGTSVEVIIPAPLTSTIAGTPGTGSKKILFVDDDPTLLQVLCSLSAELGHTAVTSQNPADLISGKINITEYDTVVTDMEMGSLKGTDILEALREKTPATPVIIMTGHQEINSETARELGFDGYLSKPITMESLGAVVGIAKMMEKTFREKANDTVTPATLCDMFDEETMREILETFKTAGTEDIKVLRACLFRRDHRKVREICHQMMPLLRQFGAVDCVEILERINGQSPQSRGKNEYWKDVELFIERGAAFIRQIAVDGT